MKKNIIKIAFQLFAYVISCFLFASCGEADSQLNYGINNIYMPQQAQTSSLSNVSYNVPGTEIDPRTFNFKREGSNINVFLGIKCSGKDVLKAFGADIITNPDTINLLITTGKLGKNVILMPSDIYTLPSHIDVPLGKSEANFNLSIDTVKLRAFAGMKLALAVSLVNPSMYQLNSSLSTTIILVSVNPIFKIGLSTTIAGSGIAGTTDGIGTSAQFNNSIGIVVDAANNLYTVDYGSNNVRKIIPSTKEVSTIAGTGFLGNVNGVGTAASFSNPMGIAIDPAGANLYIAEATGNVIRKIEIATKTVTRFAGTGVAGAIDGAATTARFNSPKGLIVDPTGVYLYVADGGSNKIRRIEIATGIVTTVAGSGTAGSTDGTGTAAKFNGPRGLAIDKTNENLFVTDYGANKIRKIVLSTKVVSTVAGSGTAAFADGIGIAASFNSPFGICIDGIGNLYVADANNHRIRKIDLATAEVTTYAGNGNLGSKDDVGLNATFNSPKGLVLGANQILYITDTGNYKIRAIN